MTCVCVSVEWQAVFLFEQLNQLRLVRSRGGLVVDVEGEAVDHVATSVAAAIVE